MFRHYPSIVHAKASTDTSHDWCLNPHWFIQEKVDGSQLSFNRPYRPDAVEAVGSVGGVAGELVFCCGRAVKTEAAVLFSKAIRMVRSIEAELSAGWTYHCEYVSKLRHNVVDYARLPRMYLIVYDIQDADGRFFRPAEMAAEAERLGLECAALLADNTTHPQSDANPVALARSLIAGGLQSQLGGQAEGVVLKHHNYQHVKYSGQWRDGQLENKEATIEVMDKKFKFVTEQFKESKGVQRVKTELTPTGFLWWIGQHYWTAARWRKGVQRLRDKQDLTYDSAWSEADKAVYVERLCTNLDADLLKEYERVVRSYISVEFGEFAKMHERASRNPTSARPASQTLQDDRVFQQLAEKNWEQRMTEYCQVVCESAREGLDVEALVKEMSGDSASGD